MKKIFLLLSILLTTSFIKSYGQQVQNSVADSANFPYWIEQMENPNANFFAVQRAFNRYWANRPIKKGSGWKVFKRWEYMKQQRADFTGILPAPISITHAFYEFKRKAGTTNSVFSGDWKCLGPFNSPGGYIGVGRINAIAFSPTDPQTLYVGAPSGGFWITHNHGASWSPLTDNLPSLGVSAILIDKTDANTIYLGTGDRDAGDAAGIGIYKSNDGGNSWQQMNTGVESATVGKIIQHPTQTQTLLAATSSGIAVSTNGGLAWTIKISGNFQDIQFNPANPSIVYASASGAFYRSIDTGTTWTRISSGFPTTINRGAIGVGPSDPNVVYFLLSNSTNSGLSGFYKSTDAGLTFQLIASSPNILAGDCAGTDTGGQGWYDLTIAVESNDINTIYIGGVNIWKSTTGGSSWQVLTGWSPSGCSGQTIHADQHFFGFSPLNGHLYIGNDGGICYTADKGSSFNEIAQNIPIAQVYKIGQHPLNGNLLANGFQDNGSSYYDGSNKSWNLLNGGDGMTCAYDPVDNIVYSTIYYGDIYRTTNGIFNGQIAGNGVNNITEKGGWVTPFIIDQSNSNVMFAGYNNIWRTQNCKDTPSSVRWEKITMQSWTKNINVIKQSTANPKILYYATENLLFRTDDCMASNVSFVTLNSYLPVKTKLITAIETHPTNENIVYVITANQIFRSEDKGLTWTEITLNLPSIFMSSLIYNKRINEGLYVGTDAGIYYKDNTMSSWVLFSTGFPLSVEVEDLAIYYDKTLQNNDRIRAGTYGRGSWESTLFYAKPTAKFSVINPSIAPGCSVQFKDQSLGVPSTYKWTFTGGTPLNSTDPNPTVRYDQPGKWDAKLVITNSMGADSITIAGAADVSSTIIPTPAFEAQLREYCASEQPSITFANTTDYCPSFYEWTVTPNNVQYLNGTKASSATPTLQFTQAGKYQISLKTGNYNGTKTETKTDYIIVQGNKLPFEEQFTSDLPSALSWQLSNTKSTATTYWTIVNVPTPSGDNKALNANFFATGADGTTRLITPAINLTGQTNPVLSFKHAYALRDANAASDSLMVSISADCGATWTRIFTGSENGHGTFATHAPTNGQFIPATKDDWSDGTYGPKSFEIDLTQWAGKDNIKLMFEAYSNAGNNLYLDNILVAPGTQIPPTNLSDQVSIYPNPSSGIVNIESKWIKKKFHLDVLNWSGTTIQQRDITPAYDGLLNQINLTKMAKGLYYIRVIADQGVFLKKIVIN
jgi:PKD repeat protein